MTGLSSRKISPGPAEARVLVALLAEPTSLLWRKHGQPHVVVRPGHPYGAWEIVERGVLRVLRNRGWVTPRACDNVRYPTWVEYQLTGRGKLLARRCMASRKVAEAHA